MHAQDYSLATNDGDHSDHMHTGRLLRDAASGRVWDLNFYLGYPVVHQPANLSALDRQHQWDLFIAYDQVMFNLMGETLVGTSSAEEWTERVYFRTERSDGTVPAAPSPASGLVAVPVTGTRIDLDWTDNANNEDGYRIERAPDVSGAPGTFTQIAQVGINVTSYNNTGLTRGVTYWYRVVGFNAAGSSISNVISATTYNFLRPASC
jgi:hypothetical protein